jgi:hypothetical protein
MTSRTKKPIKLSSTPKIKKLLEEEENVACINPYTGRPIKVGGRIWKQVQKKTEGRGGEKDKAGRKPGTYNKTGSMLFNGLKQDSSSSDMSIKMSMNKFMKTIKSKRPLVAGKKTKSNKRYLEELSSDSSSDESSDSEISDDSSLETLETSE